MNGSLITSYRRSAALLKVDEVEEVEDLGGRRLSDPPTYVMMNSHAKP